jgi:oligopeptidase A
MAPFWPARMPDYFAMIAGFSHLLERSKGYAASYYSYKGSDVFDADVFTAFKDKGLFSKDVGA